MNQQPAPKIPEATPCIKTHSKDFTAANTGNTVNFLVVDDHAITRRGINSVLSSLPSTKAIVFEAETLEIAHDLLLDNPVIDILVLDLLLPGCTGCDSLRRMRLLHPALPAVVISVHDDPQLIQEVMQLGANGFIPKKSSRNVFVAAMELILAGGVYLPLQLFSLSRPSSVLATTPRLQNRQLQATAPPNNLSPNQRKVLKYLLQGKTNREIAEGMQLTIGTVKHYVNTLLRTCSVSNRSQLFLLFGLAPRSKTRIVP